MLSKMKLLNKNLYQTGDFLKKDLLLAVGNAEEFMPTIAAVLLFGKNEKVAEVRSAVKIDGRALQRRKRKRAGRRKNRTRRKSVDTLRIFAEIYQTILRFVA